MIYHTLENVLRGTRMELTRLHSVHYLTAFLTGCILRRVSIVEATRGPFDDAPIHHVRVALLFLVGSDAGSMHILLLIDTLGAHQVRRLIR